MSTQTTSVAAQADEINALVEAFESMRRRIFEAIEADKSRPLGWLTVPFSNEGPEGIFGIEAREDGIHLWGKCWTNQTGGSTEHWDHVLPYSVLDATAASDQQETVDA